MRGFFMHIAHNQLTGNFMSEAKPQDGSTVKGYRILSPGDIEVMNRLKGVSRHFLSLLDTAKVTGADPRWVAMAKADQKDNRIFAKKKSTGRIDGVVASAMAIGAAEDAILVETGDPDDFFDDPIMVGI